MVTLANTNKASTNNNFVATPSFTVSGLITNLPSAATVNLFVTNGGNNTFFRQTTTAANGIYTFTNVPTQNYLVIAPGADFHHCLQSSQPVCDQSSDSG